MTTDDPLRAREAEAAAWFARIRSDQRTPADEHGFQLWLAENPLNQEAFETLTMLWDVAGSPMPVGRVRQPSRANRRQILAGTAAVVAGAAAYGVYRAMTPKLLETDLGEQRSLILSDDSRLVLDSGTQVKVEFSSQRRAIQLIKGRAHFDVSKDPSRPFVVDAGDKQVIAVGTAFDVSRENGATAVVLIEGKVAVENTGRDQPDVRMMAPGDRLVFNKDVLVRHDRPDIAVVTAWQNGQTVFDDVPLSEAVAMMNRYEQKPIVIADPAVGAMHISGTYRNGDAGAFVKSVATLLSVSVVEKRDSFVLRKSGSR
jgi:transmembrane sensor